jgi:hypothetical protein
MRPARDLHFVLTLTRLHRIYTLSRAELLAELYPGAPPTIAAHEALQDAFAAVAKNRFGFRSEDAVLAWVHTTARACTHHAPTTPSPDPIPHADWEDVLRRASIAISPAATPGRTSPSPRAGSWLRRIWNAATNTDTAPW